MPVLRAASFAKASVFTLRATSDKTADVPSYGGSSLRFESNGVLE